MADEKKKPAPKKPSMMGSGIAKQGEKNIKKAQDRTAAMMRKYGL